MAQWISAAGQIRALAKAVSAAFAMSSLTQEEKTPERLAFTDLPWQAPPLLAAQLLGGAPVHEYFDVPVPIDEKTIYEFWQQTLHQMWVSPSRLVRKGALATCGTYMPKVKVGQRALRFAVPAGYPELVDETAGTLFSLEVAHACAISLPVTRIVSNNDSYYVELLGQTIGVRFGRIACESPWEFDASKMVPDLLAMPRGAVDYTCHFDQIASLRSVLYSNRARFPNNFDAIDYALQGLRLLTRGAAHCPALVEQMYVAPLNMIEIRTQERALRDCIQTAKDNSISDRSKLQVMHHLLVPDVLSASGFRSNVFSNPNYPFTLAEGKLEQIEGWLRQEYKTRIPEEMRQLKGHE